MYYLEKHKIKERALDRTYTDKEELKYGHMGKVYVSTRTIAIMTLSFILLSFANAFTTEITPDVNYWDGAGNQWTCSNCGESNYCWQMSCSNCGNSQ